MNEGPIAIPQTQPIVGEVNSPAVGRNEAPPAPTNGHDPALDGFYKIAAERRERVGEAPIQLPFGNGSIGVYRSMPAGFAFDAAAAEADPYAAKRMLRSVIVEQDLQRFDEIMLLPPNNPAGVDGQFLLSFIQQLAEFYAAVPLGG